MDDDITLPSMPGAFEPTPPPTPQPETTKQPKRRFVGRRTAEALRESKPHSITTSTLEETNALIPNTARRPPRSTNQIPDSLLNDPALKSAISLLPSNYNFELPKTIHRINSLHSSSPTPSSSSSPSPKLIALQFPEGLLMYATTISDILASFCPNTSTVIMGDVTYGACCIDDFTARALGCDLLVHYAHSCLIPITRDKFKGGIETLYVFVEIGVDVKHFVATVARNVAPGKTVAVVSTVQFVNAIHQAREGLEREGVKVVVPQVMPLSGGEVLGCTAPKLTKPRPYGDKSGGGSVGGVGKVGEDVDMILYLGDGRFHLEAVMIANPDIPALRYDPYSRRLTSEVYEHGVMLGHRERALTQAKTAKKWGLILGALGRQGNPHVLTLIENHLRQLGIRWVRLLLSEIVPGKLNLFESTDEDGEGVEAWVQIACPRLSIDWGHAFGKPLLTPHEALIVLGERQMWDLDKGETYPMDYYGNRGMGRTTEKTAMAGFGGVNGTEIEVKD